MAQLWQDAWPARPVQNYPWHSCCHPPTKLHAIILSEQRSKVQWHRPPDVEPWHCPALKHKFMWQRIRTTIHLRNLLDCDHNLHAVLPDRCRKIVEYGAVGEETSQLRLELLQLALSCDHIQLPPENCSHANSQPWPWHQNMHVSFQHHLQ